jgi:hypothetical protein
MRGLHMHNMFLSGIDFWGGSWIRRTTPFREAWVLTPLMPISVYARFNSYGFYLAVFRQLTLVPITRVLGAPLTNEISALRVESQRVNIYHV